MNKTLLAGVSVVLIMGLGVLLFGSSNSGHDSQNKNVEVKDGVQYITILAKGGYSPRVSSAQANIPTKLVVSTKGTYDCSLALVIRSLNYRKILPQTGEEVIDLGTPQPGSLEGLCSMGMYSFQVNFI